MWEARPIGLLMKNSLMNKTRYSPLLYMMVYFVMVIGASSVATAQSGLPSTTLSTAQAPALATTKGISQAQAIKNKVSATLSPTFTQVKLTPQGQLNYQGLITFNGYQQLVNLYENALIKPRTLHIKSLGGDGLAGILLGTFIYQKDLHLVISEHCMSSCANFVFTSSSHITLGKNALIVFHGSFYQENLLLKFTHWYENELQQKPQTDLQAGKESSVAIVKDSEKLLSLHYYPAYQHACSVQGNQAEHRLHAKEMAKACVRYLREQEGEYFNSVSVKPKISTWGQTGGYKAIYESYQYIGFYYSLEDLKTLGIKSLVIEDGELWSPYANPYYEKVYPAALSH